MISVIIPLYNKEKSISNTIHSVLNQTYYDFELIVVDDGSTDSSSEVVQSICDHRIRLIHKENGGVSSARNVGIKAAKTDYVALLDGDDIWDSTFLEEQLKLIEEFPKAAMWGVNYAFIKGNCCTPCNQGLGEDYRGYVENYFGTHHNDLFCSTSVVIRKEVFDTVGYFDERIHYSEDLDMWYRIILKYPVVFFDKVLAYYNQNADNRCAYDLGTHHDIKKNISSYISKYTQEFKTNSIFSHYLNNAVASFLLSEGYYFGNKYDRDASDIIVKHIIYKDIHPKYRFIFKTPRIVGFLVYKFICLKKRISKSA